MAEKMYNLQAIWPSVCAYFPFKVEIEATMPCFLARVALERYDKCKREQEMNLNG
jgi:hypothetical protein